MSADKRPLRPAAAPAASTAAVDQFLQRLARAVYQFRIYPPASPFRVEAIAAAHAGLAALERHDWLDLRVTHREILLDDAAIGRDTIIERELVRRLHAASIGQLRIQCDATAEDLSQFCGALVQTIRAGSVDLVDLLVEAGVSRVEAEPVHRPEVVELVHETGPAYERLRAGRARRAAAASQPAHHLYPPDRGWIRVDPTSTTGSVSLAELAVLVGDPTRLAGILLRLTGDDTGTTADPEAALAGKYGDLAAVFSSLEPELAGPLFARLARAVLQLEDGRRRELLKRSVLPGLLDGHIEGRVLQDFPDLALAEALSLLLDLETAVPEVLSVALTRLALPDERRKAVVPLLRDRLEHSVATPGDGQARTLDRYARELIRIASGQPKDFSEFAAFDTSLDAAAEAEVARVRDIVQADAGRTAQLGCLCGLVRLEASAERLDALLAVALALVGQAQEAGDWPATLEWLSRLAGIAADISPRRPRMSERIGAALAAYVTRERAEQVVTLFATGAEARPLVARYIEITAGSMAAALVALLEDRRSQPRLPAIAELIAAHAATLAPDLAGRLSDRHPTVARVMIRALGHAGRGYEGAVAAQLGQHDPLVKREALQALARIGTREAAGVIGAQVAGEDASIRAAAAEALWHLPPAEALTELRQILSRPNFVLQHPDLVLQLLARAQTAGAGDFRPELTQLIALRWRFWRPSLVRVASAARQLLAS